MATTIKITELTNIGANLASSTVIPVVNMGGTPTTEKTVLGNIANLVLAGAGGNYVAAAKATTATTANTVLTNAQPNITSIGSLTGLTVSNATGVVNFSNTANVTLGNVSNLHIAGGTAGQLLSTNGNGTLSWASDTTTYGNSNVVTLLSAFGSNTITTTGNVSVGNIIGNGQALTNIAGANVSGFVANANVSNTAFAVAGANVSGFVANANIANTAFSVAGANVSGFVANANVSNTAYAVAAANVSGLGNIATINLTGNSSNVLYGNGVFAAVAGGANTGNVTFNDVNIIGTGNLNLQPNSADAAAYVNIYLTGAADIHMAAGAAGANLILGTDEEANIAVLQGGNVAIQAGNVSGTKTWNFDTTGNLTLPLNSVVYETNIPDQSLSGSAIALKPAGGTTANQQLLIYPTANDGDHVHMTSGNLYATELFLGSDNLYVKLANTGNIVINSNDGNSSNAMWTFGTDGSTIFPTLTTQRGDDPSATITGQTLLFGDNTQEAIISTPDGTSNINSSQRLVINPGQGFDGGEGGDIYLWAGRGGPTSGSGGDIKIRGGFAPADGTGGYIRMEGGDSQANGQPGFIEITGGQGGNTVGGYVQITGGVGGGGSGGGVDIYGGYGVGGPGAAVNISGGGSSNGLAEYGNVSINSGSGTWIFDNTGNLTVPGNLIGPDNANFTIYSNVGQHEFVFGDDGTFYAPDTVVLGGNTIYIGPGSNTLAGLEHAVLIASSNHFAYIQGVINNISDNGSADWVAQGRLGSDEGGWADFGFTSGGFNDANYTITGPGDGYLIVESYGPGQLITGPKGGNLILATGSQGTVRDIIFGTGGFETGNIFGRMSDANNSFELSRAGATITFPDATVQNTAWTGNVARIANGNSNVNIATANGNITIAAVGNTTMTITGTGANITGTANISGNVNTTGQLSATGNITTSGNFVGNGAALTNVTVNVAGNIVGTESNVTLVAGSYNWTFDNTGNLKLPGNTFAVNYANNTPVDAVTRFSGTWTVPTGNSTQSFTVGSSETYQMWVDCNIPNGILAWNATATITNTNVPVVGAQYAWVYNGGGTPIDFTSIPNQFVGTANAIFRSNTAPSATTNRFDFGINNTSGGNVTVRYGWIAIS